MKINKLPQIPLAPTPTKVATPPPQEPVPVDSLDTQKVCGAIGTMAGALLVGRPGVTLAGGALGAFAGAAVGGPIGAVIGGLAGAYGGLKFELKTKVGRLVGGLAGGAIGSAVGWAAGKVGLRPGQTLARECKGFSVGSLPSKLLNTHYTSHSKLSKEIAEDGAKHARPGDVIITSDDGDFMLELATKGIGLLSTGYGVKGHWTHLYTVDHDDKCIDILLGAGGPSQFPVTHAFTDNCHAMILRPEYTSAEHRDKTLDLMKAQFGKIDYDMKFNWKTDESQYCWEYGAKAMMAGDPGVGLKTSKFLGFFDYMTSDNYIENPKMKPVYSTGSNFWVNWLSHFT
jgi:hypothetical protein